MSAPIKSLASLARDAAKAETTPEQRLTRPRVGRFAWLAESTAAKEILAQNKARNSQVRASEPAVKVEANTAFRERFAHLLALTPSAPPAESRRDGATQAKDEAAKMVAEFQRVARVARGEAPAAQAHKPPEEAAALIKKMTSLYDKHKGAN